MAKKLDILVIVYLDDIFIYTKDPGQGYIETVRWVLDVLKRHGLFANLKKCRFYKDKVCFLGYIVLAQEVKMEDEQIETIKNWPKPTSVRDIQVFIGFANFYWRFIWGFSKIIVPLTFMLKTSGSSEKSAPKTFKANDNEIVGGDGGRANETVKNSSRKLTHMPNIGTTRELNFLTLDVKKAFNYLQLAFIKAPIFWHFDPKSHIWIKTDALGYAISGVLSQLNFDSNAPPNDSNLNKSDFGQWHLVAYFSKKMIPIKTQYKTHNTELLAIIEAFKTWRHYLKGCKYEVLVLIGHNNLRWFMDTKNLSSCQVR